MFRSLRMCVCPFTYILGRKTQASSLSTKHLCKSFSELINGLDKRKWANVDLNKSIKHRLMEVKSYLWRVDYI